MASGFGAIQLNIILKIAAFIFLAPFIGMVVAFGFTILVLHICRRVQPHKAEVWFKKLQLVSSAMFSIGHGLNDSQKVMGIIAAAMIAAHSMGLGMGINSIADLPDWVAFACFTAISLGTMSGGWKIVKQWERKLRSYSVGGSGSRNGWGVHALFNRNFKDSRKYYTYHYRGYYRCGSDQTLVCGSLGCDEKSFSRMDSYDSCQCAFGSRYLYGRYFLFRISSLLLKNDIIYKFERKIAKQFVFCI